MPWAITRSKLRSLAGVSLHRCEDQVQAVVERDRRVRARGRAQHGPDRSVPTTSQPRRASGRRCVRAAAEVEHTPAVQSPEFLLREPDQHGVRRRACEARNDIGGVPP